MASIRIELDHLAAQAGYYPKLRSPDRANMRQLRIKMMKAPAAVTPMTIMAATAKSKYAVGRSSSSATFASL